MLGHRLKYQTSVLQLQILKISGGRVGCADQNKQSLAFFFCHIQERLDAVDSQVSVDGYAIAVKHGGRAFVDHLGFTDDRIGIRSCGGADIISLGIRDDQHTLFFGVGNGLTERGKTAKTVHLIVSELRLDGRDQIVYGIDQEPVIFKYRLGGIIFRISALSLKLRKHFFRKIIQFRIQTHYGRVLARTDPVKKSVSKVHHK